MRENCKRMRTRALVLAGTVVVPLIASCASVPTDATPDAPQVAARPAGPVELTELEVREMDGGALLELSADGSLVWAQYRDDDGNLVVELPNTRIGAALDQSPPVAGLLRDVRIESQENSGRPLTRLLVETATPVEHALIDDHGVLRLEFYDGEPPRVARDELVEPVRPAAAAAPAIPDADRPMASASAVVPLAATGTPEAPVEFVPSSGFIADRLDGVELVEADRPSLRIRGNGEFEFSSFALENPDRFVLDLKGVVNRSSRSAVEVDTGAVERVRLAQFRSDPDPVARVVVDLRSRELPVVTSSADGLLLSFGESSGDGPVEPAEAGALAASPSPPPGLAGGSISAPANPGSLEAPVLEAPVLEAEVLEVPVLEAPVLEVAVEEGSETAPGREAEATRPIESAAIAAEAAAPPERTEPASATPSGELETAEIRPGELESAEIRTSELEAAEVQVEEIQLPEPEPARLPSAALVPPVAPAAGSGSAGAEQSPQTALEESMSTRERQIDPAAPGEPESARPRIVLRDAQEEEPLRIEVVGADERPSLREPSDVSLFEAQDVRIEPEPQQEEQMEEEPAFGVRNLSTERQFFGEPVSLSLKDADITEVLRSFAREFDLNIVIQPGVGGPVTVELNQVPWDQALDSILKVNGLGMDLEGSILRIAPVSRLQQEAENEQRLAQARALAVPLTTIMKRVSYASAQNIAQILTSGLRSGGFGAAGLGGMGNFPTGILSQRGAVSVDGRTNTLIIRELPEYLDTVIQIIENLDTPTEQVMIEARIVETTRNFSRTLGIDWSFSGIASAATGNTTGLQFPNNINTDGGVQLLTGGANGFLNLGLGNVLNTFQLDVALQAAEADGLINVISAPKISTLDNVGAEIQTGLQIPIQTVANNTVSVQFVNATLRLNVTPQVTAEGTIQMDIQIQKREPQLAFAVVGATNAPIATREARTRVIVRDGGTAVIGGIYTVSSNQNVDKVPGLANIPVLGHLFKNRNRSNQNEELLIFITPRVIQL
ncbi:MAG TPA: type IV pilus secretin PilQ [Thermoanaerobaculia bacterium]|nr:type IV pilus secretin PilQ [Thermoanaerobaculia bacterium]